METCSHFDPCPKYLEKEMLTGDRFVNCSHFDPYSEYLEKDMSAGDRFVSLSHFDGSLVIRM